jgi:hypothetical protein
VAKVPTIRTVVFLSARKSIGKVAVAEVPIPSKFCETGMLCASRLSGAGAMPDLVAEGNSLKAAPLFFPEAASAATKFIRTPPATQSKSSNARMTMPARESRRWR